MTCANDAPLQTATNRSALVACGPNVDRVVGQALQMPGGHLTGTLKLLHIVSDRRSPTGTGPA